MKKNSFQYMKMHWETYTIHAMDLSTAEFGALMFLTARYWMVGGPIHDDDRTLAGTTHQSLESWLGMRQRVCRFFDVRDGYLVSDHIDGLLEDARRTSKTQSKKALKRHYGSEELEHVVIPIRRAASDDDPF